MGVFISLILSISQFAVDADHTGSRAWSVSHQNSHISLLLTGLVQLTVTIWQTLFEADHLLLYIIFLFICDQNFCLTGCHQRHLPLRRLPLCHSLSDNGGHLGGPTCQCVDVAEVGQIPLNQTVDTLRYKKNVITVSFEINDKGASISPVQTVSVPFIRWLWPHNVSNANIYWLMSREGCHLISQERLLHHWSVVATVGTHFSVKIYCF